MTLQTSNLSPGKPNFWKSKRYYIAFLLFVQYLNQFASLGNVSIAIVEMASNRSMNVGNQTVTYKPEFNWDSMQKGLILGIGSYGYPLTIPGGYVINRLGGRLVIGVVLIITGLLSICSPYLLRTSLYLFLVARFIGGGLEHVAFICPSDIWSKWAAPSERARLLSVSVSGLSFGMIVCFPMFGFLAYNWGWPSLFYVPGGMHLLWALIWFSTVGSTPSNDKLISQKEVNYLRLELQNITEEKAPRCSWKRVLTSSTFWALATAKVSGGLCFTVIAMCLPSYIKDKTNLDIKSIGFLSALPNVIGFVVVPLSGFLCDYLLNRKFLSTTGVYKLLITGAIFSSAIFAFGTAFAKYFILCLILLILMKVSYSAYLSTVQSLPNCLAPKFPSIIYGYVGIANAIGHFICSMLFGVFVKTHSNLEWCLFFVSTGLFLTAGALIFQYFGSAEVQPWEYSKNHKESEGVPVDGENLDSVS